MRVVLRSKKGAVLGLAVALSGASGVLAARALAATEMVGAETCASCHTAAYEAWQQTPHAAAGSRLAGAFRQDRSCLRCHAPAREAGLTGVQCETCHGAGQHYFPEYVMRDAELARLVGLREPDEATCAECHDQTSPRLTPFDYQTALELIRHW
jgi:hypothetical protein